MMAVIMTDEGPKFVNADFMDGDILFSILMSEIEFVVINGVTYELQELLDLLESLGLLFDEDDVGPTDPDPVDPDVIN